MFQNAFILYISTFPKYKKGVKTGKNVLFNWHSPSHRNRPIMKSEILFPCSKEKSPFLLIRICDMLMIGPLQHKATQSFCSVLVEEKKSDAEQNRRQQKLPLESKSTALKLCVYEYNRQVPHNIYITHSSHFVKYHDLSQP